MRGLDPRHRTGVGWPHRQRSHHWGRRRGQRRVFHRVWRPRLVRHNRSRFTCTSALHGAAAQSPRGLRRRARSRRARDTSPAACRASTGTYRPATKNKRAIARNAIANGGHVGRRAGREQEHAAHRAPDRDLLPNSDPHHAITRPVPLGSYARHDRRGGNRWGPCTPCFVSRTGRRRPQSERWPASPEGRRREESARIGGRGASKSLAVMHTPSDIPCTASTRPRKHLADPQTLTSHLVCNQ